MSKGRRGFCYITLLLVRYILNTVLLDISRLYTRENDIIQNYWYNIFKACVHEFLCLLYLHLLITFLSSKKLRAQFIIQHPLILSSQPFEGGLVGLQSSSKLPWQGEDNNQNLGHPDPSPALYTTLLVWILLISRLIIWIPQKCCHSVSLKIKLAWYFSMHHYSQ